MTEREPAIRARPKPDSAGEKLPTIPQLDDIPAPPFEVEDRTDPEFKALLTEVIFMRKWVQSEREAGRQPN